MSNDAGRLLAGVDTENLQRLPHALVDGVRRNPELRRDFLRAQMLIDETKAVELSGSQAGDPLLHRVGGGMA
ncbi:MAG TPA: hypothetical protein VFU91_09765 [Sphingomicrobium sp.]|nr:hypothetical protein [Sphingomicrobium sp.]